jgi:hypothetical protein
MPAFAGMTFLVYNRFFNLSFLRKQESSFLFFNRQSATSNQQGIYLPLTFFLSPQGRGNFNYQLPFADWRFREDT